MSEETVKVIVAAVSGLASGLLGAVIGGAIAYLTLRKQLQHASGEARKAREHALKREVYLMAAEGMARSVQNLPRIAQPEITLEQLQEFTKADPGWYYRVAVVADLDTIKALDAAGNLIGSFTLDLTARRIRLDALRRAREEAQGRVSQLFAHTQELMKMMEAVSAPDAPLEVRALTPQVVQDFTNGREQVVVLEQQ